MTVNAAPRSAGPFTGDGTNTAFPFAFKTLLDTDPTVVVGGPAGETVLVKDTDYTVALNPDQSALPGGTVTYPISGPAMDSQHRLSIISGMEYEQATALPNGGPFNPVTIERALDNLAMQTQQVVEKVSRSVQIPVTSPEDAEAMAQAVYNVNANLAHVVGVDQNKTNIDAVAGNATNINTVAGNTTNINKVAAVDAAVATVAGIDANVTAVAGNAANINKVAAVDAAVTAVAAIDADVTAVAGNATNITAVKNNATNINKVAAVDAAVATVAGIDANVTAVAGNAANINAVAAISSDITNVSANKTAILNAADTAQKWAENPEDTAVTPGNYSALHWAAKASIIVAPYSGHIANTSNPHSVTKAQVGLGSVDNTADASKAVLSATKLTTARNIGGVSFDGSASINLPGVNTAGNQDTTGSAAKWATARTLTIGSTGKAVDGSAAVGWTLAEIGAAATAHHHDAAYAKLAATNTFTKTQLGPVTDLGSRSTGYALDGSATQTLIFTIAGNISITWSNLVKGMPYTLIVTQDGTGSRTLSWAGATVTLPTGAAIAAGANKTSIISLVALSTSTLVGNILQVV